MKLEMKYMDCSSLMNSLGIYLHIPFCVRKCGYCDFYSLPADDALMEETLAALTLQLVRAAADVSVPVDTVYFGGGTPSLFGARRIGALLDVIDAYYKLADRVEITMEANPDSLDLVALQALRDVGVNRLSIGVQSVDDSQLRVLGRLHTAEQARCAVLDAARVGFDNLSVDLMYGLPQQSLEDWHRTLESVAVWPIQHISCYGLKLEDGTPMHRQRQGMPCADDDLVVEQYLLMGEVLRQNGFEQYEISNFARMGFESRHNMKYWQLQPYLGFGPSAHSNYNGVRYAVPRDLLAYIHAMQKGDDCVTEVQAIPPHERAEEYLMLGLRTTQGVNAEAYHQWAEGLSDKPFTLLAQWQAYGFTVYENGNWRFTPTGMLISNALIGQLLT